MGEKDDLKNSKKILCIQLQEEALPREPKKLPWGQFYEWLKNKDFFRHNLSCVIHQLLNTVNLVDSHPSAASRIAAVDKEIKRREELLSDNAQKESTFAVLSQLAPLMKQVCSEVPAQSLQYKHSIEKAQTPIIKN